MAASTSSASYSALLRRSKLAAYNPHIDQVYTTTAPHLARQNFGLKRPLPAATTKTSPFVRISDLDSREGRTVFRKATREASYVKRWQETGVGLQVEAYAKHGKKWDSLQVHSRFVPTDLATGPKGGAIPEPQDASATLSRTPNFLTMTQHEFNQFLNSLEGRRDEFKQFVAEEHLKLNPNADVQDFDLYAHAQSNPNDLVRLAERFLRTLPASRASSGPLPMVHPTLALQYATPTPLESALAAPIPGRLLGPSPTNTFGRSASSGGPLSAYKFSTGPELYSSVLSTVSTVNAQNAGGLATTTFYPDAASIRSNVPGRATFRLVNPTINPNGYANRTAVETSGLRKSASFRPATAEYEPSLLSLRPIQLNPVVDTPHYTSHSPALRHPIGTPAYSGSLPPELSRQGSRASAPSSNRSGGVNRVIPQGLSSFFDNPDPNSITSSLKSLGVNPRGPRDIVAGKKNRRNKEQQEQWLRTREMLMTDRETENRRGGSTKRMGGKKGSRSAEGGNQALLGKLSSLLES
ncbi:uncharacterized protein JCM15063_000774 [Sporobolomyces koalae]|uniref:uncharacterized protein n=1 Tax=Sporobolomyces koalae TaxID=500713 RepID=UPI00316D62D1